MLHDHPSGSPEPSYGNLGEGPYGVEVPPAAPSYGNLGEGPMAGGGNEKVRQGQIERADNDAAYGYPSEPDYGPEPEEPVMGTYYWGTGGYFSHQSKQRAEQEYQKKLVAYRRQIAERKEKERHYTHDYAAAERRETRARLARAEKAAEKPNTEAEILGFGSEEEANTYIARYKKLHPETADNVTNAWDAVNDPNATPEVKAYARRMLESEIGSHLRSNPPDADKAEKGIPLQSDLWNRALAEANREHGGKATDAQISEKYSSLLDLTEVRPPDKPEDVDAEVSKKFEGQRIRNKRTGRWGTVRGGKFYPERKSAAGNR
jgi:hypothetical protein